MTEHRLHTIHPVLILLALTYLSSGGANAQQEHALFTSNMLVEGRYYYGFLYAQHMELDLFNSHLPAFELNLQQETYGKYIWERNFGYPVIGMSFWYSGLGKSPYLGSVYAIFPYVDFPIFRHKNFMMGFRFGLGAGYITKPFDRLKNYKNLAIGSHLNAAVNLMFDFRYKISPRFTTSLGINLQHFSNGSLKLPNYGINLPMVNVGLAYRLVRENPYITDKIYPPTDPFEVIIKHRIDFYFGLSAGYKNMTAVYGKNFRVYHLYENTLYPVSKKSSFGIGLDLSYDESHKAVLESHGQVVTNKLNLLRPGVNGAYQLVMSKFSVLINLGYYLGGQERSNGPLYEKISFQYDFTKHFFSNIMLKVHFGRADYIGWGLGYKFEQFYGRNKVN
ncbi:MAG: acyloxyacyl hydrolase [Bacteroidota bacterium]|nr:acyloxyacyl hydrolase [Bacteroidota bacterium]